MIPFLWAAVAFVWCYFGIVTLMHMVQADLRNGIELEFDNVDLWVCSIIILVVWPFIVLLLKSERRSRS